MRAARSRAGAAMLTGLGMITLVPGGGPLSRVPATAASQAPTARQEASRAPEAATGGVAVGGRDPFARPPAPDPRRPVEVRPSGLSGLAVDEAVLRGVVSSREGRLAVLEGPDARAYVVRPGDRLHDGRVQEVTGDGVLLLRDAADSVPLADRVVGMWLHDTESAR